MPAFDWQMNRFERIMFKVALALAALIVVIRLGAVAIIWYLHHFH